jgi:hypothetical protein
LTIRELIDLAKITSLGSYHLKDDDNAVLQLLNFSLTEVYNRVNALTESHRLVLLPNKYRYEYLSNSYRILDVHTDCGRTIPLNSELEKISVYDIGNHVLEVPEPVHCVTDVLVLILAIKPPKITVDNIDTVDFSPDDAMVSPILSFMAYMVSKNISESNGIGHLQEYEAVIQRIIATGSYNKYNPTQNKISPIRNGWV